MMYSFRYAMNPILTFALFMSLFSCDSKKTCLGIQKEKKCRAAGCVPIQALNWHFLSEDGKCLACHPWGSVCVPSSRPALGLNNHYWFRRQQSDGTFVYMKVMDVDEVEGWESMGKSDGRNYCSILDPGHDTACTVVAPEDWYPFREHPSWEQCEAITVPSVCEKKQCTHERSDWFLLSKSKKCEMRFQNGNICVSTGMMNDNMERTWFMRTREDGSMMFILSQAVHIFGWTKTRYDEFHGMDMCEILDTDSGIPWTEPESLWYPFGGLW